MEVRAILQPQRTEHAKAIRRQYGDRGGHCRFTDKYYTMSPDSWSNTISTVTKDNMLCYEYS